MTAGRFAHMATVAGAKIALMASREFTFIIELDYNRFKFTYSSGDLTQKEVDRWCEEMFGPPAITNIRQDEDGNSLWDVDYGARWERFSTTWFFRNAEDATMFKLRWC